MKFTEFLMLMEGELRLGKIENKVMLFTVSLLESIRTFIGNYTVGVWLAPIAHKTKIIVR